jgi:heavy metal sensor kinase
LKRLTIQARLTAWYLLSMAVIVALFAGGSWVALRASMYHSIDRDLRYRLAAVVPYIEGHSLNTREQFARTFASSSDASIVGVFIQITNEQSQVLYESDVLRSHKVPVMGPAPADGSEVIASAGQRGWPVRVAGKRVVVGSAALTVHVVEPLRDVLNSLSEYGTYLVLLGAAALVLTTTAGYWMSRRALAPVEEIRQEAEAIDAADLATRLRVPPTEDELARLARTLNSMLTRIEEGFRSVQQFTADASHELRAPLALIITAGDVSLRRERSREELTETLSKVVREARRMSRLVEDLLALARGDTRRANQELAPVDMVFIVRELCSELAPAAKAKALILVAAFPVEEAPVMGDCEELRRLFVILLDNAIKYTEAGSITVTLKREDGLVKAIVADTGIGIEKDALPHVFDRFWRADKVRSRTAGGAGLGLSLALQIVRNHGGTISVDSEPGRGSKFVVELKSAAVSEELARRHSPE